MLCLYIVTITLMALAFYTYFINEPIGETSFL